MIFINTDHIEILLNEFVHDTEVEIFIALISFLIGTEVIETNCKLRYDIFTEIGKRRL